MDITNTSALSQPAGDRTRLRELAAGRDQADNLRVLIDHAERSDRDRRRADAVFFAALRQIAHQMER